MSHKIDYRLIQTQNSKGNVVPNLKYFNSVNKSISLFLIAVKQKKDLMLKF